MSLVSYPYAVSVIKVHEDSLIDRTEWNRLIEADIREAYRLLHDMGYGQKASNPNDIDSLTRANVAQAKELVREISPAPELTNLLLLQTDAHNIKCVLKGMLENEEVEDILLEGGSISLPELLAAFEKDNFETFPEKLREAVEAFDPEQSPRALSANIDDAVFEQVHAVLQEGHGLEKLKIKLSDKNAFMAYLSRYFTAKTDFTNIITVLRVRRLGWDAKALEALIVPDGEIPGAALVRALDAQTEGLAEILGVGSNGYYIKNALREFESAQDISALDLAFFRKLFDIAHENYNESLGIGPLINYIVQKEFEARALRRLFQAKRAGESITASELGIA